MFVQKGIETFLETTGKRALKKQGPTTFYQSGVEHAPCNGVFEGEKNRVLSTAEIALVKEEMKGLPFIWWSNSSLLAREGFDFGGELIGIEMEIRTPLALTSIEMRQAKTKEEIRLFTELAIEAFEMLPSLLESMSAMNTDKNMVHLLAYVEGKPVGTVTLLFGKEGVGIWNLGTLKAYRKQGIGYQLVNEALREAQRRGYKNAMAVLMPKGLASTLFTQHGFQEVSKYPFYIYGAGAPLE